MGDNKQSSQIEINFEVCQNCSNHSWCTHHDEKKYLTLYQEMKQSFEKNIPNLKCVMNVKKSRPSMGAFEISHQGVIIFSKISTGLFPSVVPTTQRVVQFLQDLSDKKDVQHYQTIPNKKYEAPRKAKVRPTFESFRKLKEEEANQIKSQSLLSTTKKLPIVKEEKPEEIAQEPKDFQTKEEFYQESQEESQLKISQEEENKQNSSPELPQESESQQFEQPEVEEEQQEQQQQQQQQEELEE